MNLPSSLALPQSKLFQSRIFLLILLLVVALIGVGVFFFVLHPMTPAKSPTVATSPAAVATPRPAMKAPVVYGPPAPDWVKRTPMPPPAGAIPTAAVPGPATPLVAPPAAVPGAATAVGSGTAVLAPGLAVTPGAAGVVTETPKSLDASVLFAREQYVYTSGNRRDPFLSLLDGKFLSQSGDGSLVDVGDIHLVGIMWGASDKFALVEDSRGRGFVLRVGDPVVNGYISGISKSEIQVVQNAFGETQTLAIQLKAKEGDRNATRK
jgi:hypothetical protein